MEERIEKQDTKAQVEALIFGSPKPLTVQELTEFIEVVPQTEVHEAVQSLKDEYDKRDGGFLLKEVGAGYQFQTHERMSGVMAKVFTQRPRALTRAAQETLAIIAYRQPVTRAEVEFIRGVDAGSIFKTLMERDLIKCVGRKEIAGRPMVFGTTQEFLRVFNLDSVQDLPPLESFQPSVEVREALEKIKDFSAEAAEETLVNVDEFV